MSRRDGKENDMAREKVTYRDQLELICRRFPNKELLSTSDVAEYCGCSTRTVSRRFAYAEWTGAGTGKRITRAALARALS
jgi:AraC-like DNA-binding protein